LQFTEASRVDPPDSQRASYGTNAFLMLFVPLPSLTRVAIRFNQAKPYLKFFNIVVLLVLSCSNAAVSLPTAFRHPDIDFLSVTLQIVHFVPGLIRRSMGDFPRRFSASREQEPALIFGLCISNNGTGLVLASASLAGHPLVTLPIIFYNLQHLIAGAVDHVRYRAAE
jgi:BASS family bile acid:Na+ symporter